MQILGGGPLSRAQSVGRASIHFLHDRQPEDFTPGSTERPTSEDQARRPYSSVKSILIKEHSLLGSWVRFALSSGGEIGRRSVQARLPVWIASSRRKKLADPFNRIVTSNPESVNWGSQKMFSTEYRLVGSGWLRNNNNFQPVYLVWAVMKTAMNFSTKW